MRLFGLLGKTLKHSFSQAYFREKFQRLSLSDCRYENFELADISEIKALLLSHPELAGLNVTIPYKESVLPFLTACDDVVQSVGACNCIQIRDGALLGYNTDVAGFRQSLLGRLGSMHDKALVLGTGGASKAVVYVLKQLNIPFQMVSRRKEPGYLTYDELDGSMVAAAPLIINTTPLGMYPDTELFPPIDYEAISGRHLLYNLVYNPETTQFMKKGAAKGASVMNGYGMLVIQAEESWRIWNG